MITFAILQGCFGMLVFSRKTDAWPRFANVIGFGISLLSIVSAIAEVNR